MDFDPVEFQAAIAPGASAFRIGGSPGDGGKVILEAFVNADQTDFMKLVLFRGRSLKLRVEDAAGLAPLEFQATIADSDSAIKFPGGAGDPGKVTFETSGNVDLAQMMKLVLYRGRRLRVRIAITGDY